MVKQDKDTELFIGSFDEGDRIIARLDAFEESGWGAERVAWLKKNKGKKLTGTVVMDDNSIYFRPDEATGIILSDEEVTVISSLAVTKTVSLIGQEHELVVEALTLYAAVHKSNAKTALHAIKAGYLNNAKNAETIIRKIQRTPEK